MELEAMDASQSESMLNRFNADVREDVATQCCCCAVVGPEVVVVEVLVVPRNSPWKKTPGARAEVTESPMDDTEAVPLCGWGMATTLLLVAVAEAVVVADAQSLETIPVAVKELSAVVAVAALETESVVLLLLRGGPNPPTSSRSTAADLDN